MKQITTTILLAFVAFASNAQLNGYAQYFKENNPKLYENIKTHAVNEWSNNHKMVLYEINKQSTAVFGIVKGFETENTFILKQAMLHWSWDGYESHTETYFAHLKTINYTELQDFHCNWKMVLYEYNKQVAAKNAY